MVKSLSADSDAKIEKFNKQSDTKIEKLKKEATEEIKHYIGALMEQYKWDLAAILENTKGTPAMYEKVEILFENMGQQEIDIAILKEAVLSHKKKFQQLGV